MKHTPNTRILPTPVPKGDNQIRRERPKLDAWLDVGGVVVADSVKSVTAAREFMDGVDILLQESKEWTADTESLLD